MAVKIFRSDDEEKTQASIDEYNTLKDLKHPCIIDVKDMYQDTIRNTLYTVMEYF